MECVTFDLAKKLKEIGFKEGCFFYYIPSSKDLIPNINQWRGGNVEDCLYSYNSLGKDAYTSDFVDAPTVSQAVEWLESKHKLFILVDCCWAESITWSVSIKSIQSSEEWEVGACYHSHGQALLAGIEFILTKII